MSADANRTGQTAPALRDAAAWNIPCALEIRTAETAHATPPSIGHASPWPAHSPLRSKNFSHRHQSTESVDTARKKYAAHPPAYDRAGDPAASSPHSLRANSPAEY